jgi:hypothetical protein
MFEHHHQPLLPRGKYLLRLLRHGGMALVLLIAVLAIGIFGYHGFEGLSFVDSLVNASMILGGMGPVNSLHTNAGKVFASGYALFSGIVFLFGVGVLLAPVIHRFLHKFHLEDKSLGNEP